MRGVESTGVAPCAVVHLVFFGACTPAPAGAASTFKTLVSVCGGRFGHPHDFTAVVGEPRFSIGEPLSGHCTFAWRTRRRGVSRLRRRACSSCSGEWGHASRLTLDICMLLCAESLPVLVPLPRPSFASPVSSLVTGARVALRARGLGWLLPFWVRARSSARADPRQPVLRPRTLRADRPSRRAPQHVESCA